MFTVTWTQFASDQLADIWMRNDAASRGRITRYVGDLDRHLRANGDRIGESREAGVRVLTNPPLGIEFRVSMLDRMITVARVWSIASR